MILLKYQTFIWHKNMEGKILETDGKILKHG